MPFNNNFSTKTAISAIIQDMIWPKEWLKSYYIHHILFKYKTKGSLKKQKECNTVTLKKWERINEKLKEGEETHILANFRFFNLIILWILNLCHQI